MKIALLALPMLFVITCGAQTQAGVPGAENQVRAFYAAFNNHNWAAAAEFATADWVHINPFGGRTVGRSETLKDLEHVHSTFLKGVKDVIEHIESRAAGRDAAIVTVFSRVDGFTTPDGLKHAPSRQIRTFVVVQDKGRWRIKQDQNTFISE